MKSQEIQLGGKTVTVRKTRRPLKDTDGYCRGGKEIVISAGLSSHDELRVFLHESLHALFWFLDEEVVDTASRELAEALEALDLA